MEGKKGQTEKKKRRGEIKYDWVWTLKGRNWEIQTDEENDQGRLPQGHGRWALQACLLDSLLSSTIPTSFPVFQASFESLPWFSLALPLSCMSSGTYPDGIKYLQARLPSPGSLGRALQGRASRCVYDPIFYCKFLHKVWPMVWAPYVFLKEYMSNFKFIQSRALSKGTEGTWLGTQACIPWRPVGLLCYCPMLADCHCLCLQGPLGPGHLWDLSSLMDGQLPGAEAAPHPWCFYDLAPGQALSVKCSVAQSWEGCRLWAQGTGLSPDSTSLFLLFSPFSFMSSKQ